MQLNAKARLRASEDYGWYVLTPEDKVVSGPHRTENEAKALAVQKPDQKAEYGCEEGGKFESLSQYGNL